MTKATLGATFETDLARFATSKLLVLAAGGGLIIGALVAFIRIAVGKIQILLFGLNIDRFNPAEISPWRISFVIILGSLLLGGLLLLARRLQPISIVDPVEANALEGGKMSLRDSLILASLSVVSISIGGSVGFEAAMTQLGAGFLSFIGQVLKLKRGELRILVSCGTGAGIAAIFGAPLAGTFYALELVIGGYGMRALFPTLLASAASAHVVYLCLGDQPIFLASHIGAPAFWHFPIAIFIGVTTAVIGIAVMRGTTDLEKALNHLQIPLFFKPLLGSILLALMAVLAPQVMGPGQFGVTNILAGREMLMATTILLLAKIGAMIASVGSGFRGGLFSGSLLLGASVGCLSYELLFKPWLGSMASLDLIVIAGMAGVATSIIGTPIAILLLMVESAGLETGVITTAVTVIIASHLTRYWFGYSFSTWKFHLRGHSLTGPRDIGRLANLKFADLKLQLLATVTPSTSFSDAISLAKTAAPFFIALEKDHRFVGLLSYCQLLALQEQASEPDFVTAAYSPLSVVNSDSIANLLPTLQTLPAQDIAVLDQEGKLLGLTNAAVVFQRYLQEVLITDAEDALQRLQP